MSSRLPEDGIDVPSPLNHLPSRAGCDWNAVRTWRPPCWPLHAAAWQQRHMMQEKCLLGYRSNLVMEIVDGLTTRAELVSKICPSAMASSEEEPSVGFIGLGQLHFITC